MAKSMTPAALALTVALTVTAFFDLHLRGIPRPLLDGPTPAHPEVQFHRPGPAPALTAAGPPSPSGNGGGGVGYPWASTAGED
jgi:hypothetical protein